MPTTPSAIETELMKATKLRQAANEPRHKWLGRLLETGQNLPPAIWNNLTPEAQAWYNDGINAYNVHSKFEEIPDFVDITPPTIVERATMARKPEPAPEPEPEAVDEPEPEAVDEDEFEDLTAEEEEGDETEDEYVDEEAVAAEPEEEEEFEEPEPEPPPKKAAAPKKAPPKKAPPPKAAPKKAARPNFKKTPKPEVVSRPPKPGAPGASTMVKRMLLKDINITNAELMEKLAEQGVSVTAITVSTLRSDFRHSLRVLQEAGYCTDLAASIK